MSDNGKKGSNMIVYFIVDSVVDLFCFYFEENGIGFILFRVFFSDKEFEDVVMIDVD